MTDRANSLDDYPCAKSNARLIQHAADYPVIVMIARWSVYVEGHDPRALDASNPEMFYADGPNKTRTAKRSRQLFARYFQDTVERLLAHGARRLVIIRHVPEYPFWVPNELTRLIDKGMPLSRLDTSLASHRTRQRFVDRVFDNLARDHRVQVLDPADVLCGATRCAIERNGKSLYRDDDHLSLYGASLLGPMLEHALPPPYNVGKPATGHAHAPDAPRSTDHP